MGLAVAQHRLGIVELGENAKAAFIIELTVQSRRDMPGRAVQQPRAQSPFELPDRLRRRGSGNTEVVRCGSEAAAFDDTQEQAKRLEVIHTSLFAFSERKCQFPADYPGNRGRYLSP
jgi:hypothetical protein